jgi:hypothetical protein
MYPAVKCSYDFVQRPEFDFHRDVAPKGIC